MSMLINGCFQIIIIMCVLFLVEIVQFVNMNNAFSAIYARKFCISFNINQRMHLMIFFPFLEYNKTKNNAWKKICSP